MMKNKIVFDHFGNDADFTKVASKLTTPYIPKGRYYKITRIDDTTIRYYDLAEPNDRSIFNISCVLTIPQGYASNNVKSLSETIHQWSVGDVFIRFESSFTSTDPTDNAPRMVIMHVDNIGPIHNVVKHPEPDYQHLWFENVVDPFEGKVQVEIAQVRTTNSVQRAVNWIYDRQYNNLFVNENGTTYLVTLSQNSKVDLINRTITVDVLMAKVNDIKDCPYAIPFLGVIMLGKECNNAHFRVRLNAEYREPNSSTWKTLEEYLNV